MYAVTLALSVRVRHAPLSLYVSKDTQSDLSACLNDSTLDQSEAWILTEGAGERRVCGGLGCRRGGSHLKATAVVYGIFQQ